jgi:hypothetical protein
VNFQVVWAAIQPLFTQLLQSPQFKQLVDKVWADFGAKVAAGVHPVVATQQAQGQIAAGALLHLTGNFGADLQAFFAALKPSNPTSVGFSQGPAPPAGPGTYTS